MISKVTAIMMSVSYLATIHQIEFSKESYLGHSIIYIPTEFPKNISIRSRDMPPKRNQKWAL